MVLSKKPHKHVTRRATHASHAKTHEEHKVVPTHLDRPVEAAHPVLTKVISPLEPSPNLAAATKAVSESAQPDFNVSETAAGHDQLDSRQEFFRLMSEKIKEEQAGQPETTAENVNQEMKIKSVGLYRKIAIRFIVLAVILVLIVGYFSLTKLTILITPNKEVVPNNFSLDIYGADLPANSEQAIKGNIARIEVEQTGNFAATGEKVGNEQFSGKVKLVNNYSKDQPLVATTRLLSADNKLFRLKNSVTIPAGGSVEADVYPDKPGSEMAIGPSKFTIPGLWSGLQDKIYGESSAAFTLNADSKKFIQPADLEKAKVELSAALVEKVKQSIGASGGQYDQVVYESSADSIQVELVDAKIGDEKAEFTAKAKNIVNVISFASEDVAKLAQAKIAANLGDDKILLDIDKNTLSFKLESYNAANNSAVVSATVNGQVASKNTDFIDKSKLVNLNRGQLESYLKSISQVNSFDLKFFPSFIKRSPSLVDRITIDFQ